MSEHIVINGSYYELGKEMPLPWKNRSTGWTSDDLIHANLEREIVKNGLTPEVMTKIAERQRYLDQDDKPCCTIL